MTDTLFLLSPAHYDALAELATGAGWRVVTATTFGDAGREFGSSGALLAVLDLRDAEEAAMRAAPALGRIATGQGAQLLALVSRDRLDLLDDLRAVGATRFLAAPFAPAEFVQALRFAATTAERRRDPRSAARPTGAALDGFLARDLERALEADEIDILFQPQVAIADDTIVGVEALMRWRHGELGELGAEALLDAADRAGLAVALSSHVQARALAEAAAWPAECATLRLSLNVTADDLAEPDFAQTLLDRVMTSGFPRDRLTVEITERGLIAEPDRAASVLAELRDAGLRVAIDDFGTGHSSLAYLSQLPLDYLKLDRVLTQGIAGSQRDRVVVRGIVGLAHALGLSVIAEGVETADQRDLLADEGCAIYQGYLCAGPLTTGALASLLTTR